MNILTHLDQTVTPAVLGVSGNVAQISLLEHFYALMVSRLAVLEVYQQLQFNEQKYIEQNLVDSSNVRITLFEQLWQQDSQRHLLIQELAATHHIPEITTEALVVNTAQLAYQELKVVANGHFLPEFLQLHQSAIRPYLPVWAAAVIAPVVAVVNEASALAPDALIYNNSQVPKAAAHTDQLLAADSVPVIVESTTGETATAHLIGGMIDSMDAIHANPAAYRAPDNDANVSRAEIRARNQRNDLIVRLALLAAALSAILLLWLFVFKKDKEDVPVETAVSTPVSEPTPEIAPPVQPLTPAQLLVSVDNSGNLYACSATVGDIGLQTVLKQALQTSFSEQASICEISVQSGVATSLTNVNIDTLPNVLMLMRATPFARLQLQNDSMSLDAPDNGQLQQLVGGVRNLLPTLNIISTAPASTVAPVTGIVQPPANTYDETYNNSAYNNGGSSNGMSNNGVNGTMQYNGSAPITNANNVISNQQSPPPAYNNNTDSVAPPPQPSQNNPLPQSSMPMNTDTADLEKPVFIDQATIKNAAN
ncbi:hypothetical protein [Psychrobacter sp. 16-MNA-CIBAN-0192]|uniref:hypothetical protein n=1 Tax=Psychrobacter sp. 16-MNA-CIBAN-0192 TaxID=3140448 RepID=UPI00333409F9